MAIVIEFYLTGRDITNILSLTRPEAAIYVGGSGAFAMPPAGVSVKCNSRAVMPRQGCAYGRLRQRQRGASA